MVYIIHTCARGMHIYICAGGVGHLDQTQTRRCNARRQTRARTHVNARACRVNFIRNEIDERCCGKDREAPPARDTSRIATRRSRADPPNGVQCPPLSVFKHSSGERERKSGCPTYANDDPVCPRLRDLSKPRASSVREGSSPRIFPDVSTFSESRPRRGVKISVAVTLASETFSRRVHINARAEGKPDSTRGT